jgi:hypothetical protein
VSWGPGLARPAPYLPGRIRFPHHYSRPGSVLRRSYRFVFALSYLLLPSPLPAQLEPPSTGVWSRWTRAGCWGTTVAC